MDLTGHAQPTETDAAIARFMREFAPSAGAATAAPRFGPQALTDLFAYWSSLPRPGGAPAAADFDPLEIASLTPDMTVIEMRAPDDLRYRLAGTRISERMGHDPTGLNLCDLLAPDGRIRAARDQFEAVLRPCAFHIRYKSVYGTGRIAYTQTLGVPLRGSGGHPPRIVGLHVQEEALAYEAAAGQSTLATEVDTLLWIDTGCGTP